MGRKKSKAASAAREKRQGYREELREIAAEVEKFRGRLEKVLQDPEFLQSVRPGLEIVLFELPLTTFSCAVSLRPASPRWTFTKREKSILMGLKEGKGDKQIAGALRISSHTVHASINRLFNKTGLHSRLLLVRLPLCDLM
jgi:DNA-binding CsgD family transcriptional regulator